MRQGLCQLQISHGPYCVIKFLKLLSEVQIRIMNTHQGFWTILIKHCRIYDLPNLPAEYNSVCRVWICSGKICRARLSKTKGYLCDFVNVHHSPPPPPTPSIYDWHRINNGPYFWGTNHPCTNSKRWPSWLLRLSAPIWYFAIFPLAFKPIHADIKNDCVQ